MAGEFTDAEREYYQKCLPQGVILKYNYISKCYDLKIRPEGSSTTILLRRIRRTTVLDWTNPTRVFNYIARRSLAAKGYPVEFRVK